MQMRSIIWVVAAAVVLWGWETHLLAFGAAMAVALTASEFTRKRIALTQRELGRFWDVTMLIAVAAALYNRQTAGISMAVFTFLQWLPILCFPFVAAAVFSGSPRLPFSTFLFWWRRRSGMSSSVDVRAVYFAVCLLSASASSRRDPWFYPAVILMIAAALWLHRPRRIRAAVIVPLFLLISLSGYLLQAQWREFTTRIEHKTMSWFVGFFPKQFEDQETHTDIGEIGELKSSGRVLMRVRHASGANFTRLLRQVSFDQYRRGIWLSTRRGYSTVTETSPGTWELRPTSSGAESLAISAPVPTGQILLALPMGAKRIRRLDAGRLERNRFGNLRVWDSPDPLHCMIDYDPQVADESLTNKTDLQIPRLDEPVVNRLVEELGLRSMSSQAALDRVERFFAEQFRYTSFVTPAAGDPISLASPIATFLTQTRSGHCEYFATAAALLLRKIGIPARYAVGYALVESGGSDRQFVVRERHTHSWVLAHVDGQWRDFDPTPARWNQAELARSTIWRPLADRWSDLRFAFATWQWWPEFDRRLLMALLVPCAAGLVWTLLRRRRQKFRTVSRRPSLAEAMAWPGLDSEFFLVERALQKRGLSREQEETTAALIHRAIAAKLAELEPLLPALDLHYRYRFDPEGLPVDDRQQLAQTVHRWLNERK